MQRGLIFGAALACLACLVTPSRAETAIVLDPFLGGLLPQCQGSKSFDQFRQSVAARHGHDAGGKRPTPNAPIVIPPDIKRAMGAITAENRGEYTEVVAPLSGKFRSLPVSAIEFAFGNENGIDVTIVRFAASKSEVAQVLGRDITRAARLIKRRVRGGDTGADQSVTLDAKGGQARLICDTSN